MIGHVYRAIAFGAITLVCSGLALFTLWFAPVWSLGVYGRAWGRWVLRATGVEVEASGLEHLSPERAALLMATHSSHFDTLCLYATLPVRVRFVAKKSLTYIPVFGWALLAGAAVVIDRANRKAALASIARARRLLEGGEFILMFPEGTRTPEGTVGPLKKGPFHLAEEARVPVVPVAVVGTGRILAPGDWRIRPGRVRVAVGAPIRPDELPAEAEEFRKTLTRTVEDRLRMLITTDARADSLDTPGGPP